MDPSARICLSLAWGTVTEKQLRDDVVDVADQFVEDPSAMTMGTNL